MRRYHHQGNTTVVGDDDDDDDATDDGKDKYENVDQFIRDSYTKQALG